MHSHSKSPPGIYFHSEQPVHTEDLPRMDVAAFVGFAEKGPLHTPVVVETIQQFRDIFGDDIPLAWDLSRNRWQYSLLGGSVEAFFANGGVRCEVVRVAAEIDEDAGVLESRQFALHGVYELNAGAGLRQAKLQTRSPGTWGDNLRLGTRVNIQLLPPDYSTNSAFGAGQPLGQVGDQWQIFLQTVPVGLGSGDLLEISFNRNFLKLFVFIDTVTTRSNGVLITANEGFWFDYNTASPSLNEPIALFAVDGLDRMNAIFGSGEPADLSIKYLTLSLSVWDQGLLSHKINGLAFHGEHPRCWQNLPDDLLLYRELTGQTNEEPGNAHYNFISEISTPRFPLSTGFVTALSREVQTKKFRSLPLHSGSTTSIEKALKPEPLVSSPHGLSLAFRNGLNEFSSVIFLDRFLATNRKERLKSEIEHRHIRLLELILSRDSANASQDSLGEQVDRVRPKGIYSLFCREQVSMITVPDSAHRPWGNSPPPALIPLAAPTIDRIQYNEQKKIITLRWEKILDAQYYVIEHLIDQENSEGRFYQYDADDQAQLDDDYIASPANQIYYSIQVEEGCEKVHRFRAYAHAHSERSAWSNTGVITLPQNDFHDCDAFSPEFLGLVLGFASAVDDDGEVSLSWMAENEYSQVDAFADRFILERALDIDFSLAERFAVQVDSPRVNTYKDDKKTDTTVYYRIRALSGTVAGPWSNTIFVEPTTFSKLVLTPEQDYPLNEMLEVNISLLRLCASRMDLSAILTFPEHFRINKVVNGIQALTALEGGFGEFPVQGLAPPLDASEESVLSYGGIFHPWVIGRINDTQQINVTGSTVRNLPVAGFVCGNLASVSNQRGAWISSANKALIDVQGLVDPEMFNQQTSLYRIQVNAVVRKPAGFIVSAMDTLSLASDYRAFNVRRLFNLLHRVISREGNRYIFENNDDDFRNRIAHHWQSLLADLHQRGALRGNSSTEAFRVVVDDSNNDQRTQDNGKLFVELHVAPSLPLRFIRVLLMQSATDNFLLEGF